MKRSNLLSFWHFIQQFLREICRNCPDHGYPFCGDPFGPCRSKVVLKAPVCSEMPWSLCTWRVPGCSVFLLEKACRSPYRFAYRRAYSSRTRSGHEALVTPLSDHFGVIWEHFMANFTLLSGLGPGWEFCKFSPLSQDTQPSLTPTQGLESRGRVPDARPRSTNPNSCSRGPALWEFFRKKKKRTTGKRPWNTGEKVAKMHILLFLP